MVTFGKILVLIAAVLAILVSLYLLFSPQYGQEVTATTLSGEPAITETIITRQSWYQVQGPWGVFLLLLLGGLYGLGYYLARKESYNWLGTLNLGLLIFSYVAGLSVGLLYMPAALIMALGTALLLFSRHGQAEPNGSST